MNKSTLRGLCAQAYCTKRNEKKVLDTDLIEDMVDNISKHLHDTQECDVLGMLCQMGDNGYIQISHNGYKTGETRCSWHSYDLLRGAPKNSTYGSNKLIPDAIRQAYEAWKKVQR